MVSAADGPDACLCQPGFTPSGEACVACAAEAVKHVTSNASCIDCPAHSTLLPGVPHDISNCVCDPGYYSVGALQCSPCAPGSYKSSYGANEVGAAGCASCGAHTTGAEAATNRTECLCATNYEAGPEDGPDVGGHCVATCGAGTEGTAGTCEACEYGTFKTGIGTACADCAAPRIASPGGATAESQCTCTEGHMGMLAADAAVVQSIGAELEAGVTPHLGKGECAHNWLRQPDALA